MAEEIRFEDDEVAHVIKLRVELMRTVPITDHRITQLDCWLLVNTRLPTQLLVSIYSRVLWVSAVEYEIEKDREAKHFRLQALKRWHEEYRAAPEIIKELLAPFWLTWADVLNTEEKKYEEEMNGAA